MKNAMTNVQFRLPNSMHSPRKGNPCSGYPLHHNPARGTVLWYGTYILTSLDDDRINTTKYIGPMSTTIPR